MFERRSFLCLLLIVASAVLGCDLDAEDLLSSEDQRNGPRSVIQEGFRYQAEFTVRDPDFIAVQVSITNLRDGPATLRFPDRCVVLMRVFLPGGGRQVFDQFNKTCRPDQPVTATFEPDESKIFETNALTHFMLEDRPEGFYDISVYLRPVGQPEIEIMVGSAELTRLDVPGSG